MVHYFKATEEQRELADGARKILEKELKPRLEELEKANDGLAEYPMDVHKIMADAGYYAMNIPEEWGGLGFDAVTKALIVEEMSQVDAGFTFSFFNAGNLFPMILQTGLSKEEKQNWADRLLSGEAMGTFCLTEPNAGSDATAMSTTAVRDGDEWVINGRKCFITNAPVANFFVVFAWTDKTVGAGHGVSAFLVEKERGVEVGKKENKLGLKLSSTGDVIFDDVRVPADHLIGEEGRGFGKALAMINAEGRTLGGAFNLGIAQSCVDNAVEYAKTRRQFGKRIIDLEGLGFLIADMKARTDACRAFVYNTLEAVDAGQDIGCMSNEVKLYVSDCTMQTAIDAVQVLGGYGYMKDYPVEKLMRDAKIFQIFSGTNQIQRRTIARTLAGRDPERAKR